MNRVLAFMFFMLFLAGMAFLMLRNMQSVQDMSEQKNLTIVDGEWQRGEQSITFSTDGTVAGFGGCNRFTGSYLATDTTIDIGPLAATRRACPEPVMDDEMAFFRLLESVDRYDISGRTLTMQDPDNNELSLGFQQPATMEGETS